MRTESEAGAAADGRGARVRRWVPAAWAVYGAAYVAVFAARGEVRAAVVAAVVVAVLTVGLAWEVRRPQAARPQLFGWEQDERQRMIHQWAMAFVGYLMMGAALVGGFVAFVVRPESSQWPMLALGVLTAAYLLGTAIAARRG